MAKVIKILIDPGHGGKDPGAQANGLQEKVLVLGIAKRIKALLEEYADVEVRLTRNTDVFIELSDRAKISNSWGADIFISIHINASGGTGFETFIYNGTTQAATISNQNVIHAAIIREIGGTDRGKKRGNLAVLRETNTAALLTELAFIDNAKDAAKLKKADFLEKAAQGHVNGVVSVFGLKKKATAVKPAESEWSKELKESVKFVQDKGLSDGTRTGDVLKRGEFFAILKRMNEKGLL